jgi:hypothetical protein
VSVQSPYVRGTLATTVGLAPLVAAMPRLEVSVARPLLSFAPWAPSAAAGVTAPGMPAAHMLVVGAAVALHFAFEAQEDLAAGAAASFTATVNGSPLPLGDAAVSAKSLVLSFSAASAVKHTFVFVAFGTMLAFVVDAARVYSFPTIVGTSRSAKPVVTLGEQLPVVSTFDAALPSGMTASAVVTAFGFEAEAASYVGALSGSAVGFSVLVARDVDHSATVTLSYGGSSRGGYSWGSGALTAASIYTFPSSFTVDGSANGYEGGATLKANATGSLKLTFVGGDMLFSDSVTAQVSYVEYTQDGTTLPISSGLTCSNPLETLSIGALTPAAATELEIKVQLKGPDNALSSELRATVAASAFEAPSTLPQLAFKLPETASGNTVVGTLSSSGQLWTNAPSATMQGTVIDYAFPGDFRLVIAAPGWSSAGGWRPLTNAMVCSSGASPSDFRLNSTSFSTSAGCLANFTPSASYTYTIPVFVYNTRNQSEGGFLTRANTCYKYERTGDTLQLSYGVGAVGPWTVLRTVTTASASKVLCLLGVGSGTSSQTVSSIRTAYKGASPVKSIYVTDASGMRTSGYSADASASSLVVAWPCDGVVDVSHNINAASATKTITMKPNATVVATASAKYYGAALYTDTLVTANRSAIISGLPSGYLNGDFTFEAWIRPQASGGYVFGSLPLGYGISGFVDNRSWNTPNHADGLGTLHQTGAAQVSVELSQGGFRNITSTSSSFVSVMGELNAYDALPLVHDQWSHYALTKEGNKYSVYINGIAVSSYTDPLSRTLTGYNTTLMVAGMRNDGSASNFFGYIQDVRVYISCKYTSNFYVKYDGTM